jgi:two-component system response regulator AtoC
MAQRAAIAEIRPTTDRVSSAANQREDKVFCGASPAMNEICERLRAVAMGDVPVLLLGETGTGKEVIARSIHTKSARANKPFVKLNCAAVPSELVESELFGHERGAFTGADRRKIGLFEMADGGTIFLDEIGDMEFRLQAKLLQVLQDQEFRRVGGYEFVQVNVRLVAATHCDLETAITQNRFRQDLYYRLNVCCFRMPSLRERPEDVIPLTEFLLQRHAGAADWRSLLTDELARELQQHTWPGNVRELENVVRKLVAIGDPSWVTRDLRAKIAPTNGLPRTVDRPAHLPPQEPLKKFEEVIRQQERAEMEAIVEALEVCRWNRKRAAAHLGMDYKALLYKMKKLNIGAGRDASESPDQDIRPGAGRSGLTG